MLSFSGQVHSISHFSPHYETLENTCDIAFFWAYKHLFVLFVSASDLGQQLKQISYLRRCYCQRSRATDQTQIVIPFFVTFLGSGLETFFDIAKIRPVWEELCSLQWPHIFLNQILSLTPYWFGCLEQRILRAVFRFDLKLFQFVQWNRTTFFRYHSVKILS